MVDIRSHFVRAIPAAERARLLAMLDDIELPRGSVLWEPGDELRTLFLPETCVVSVLQPFVSGEIIETATVGCEGVVCPTTVLGANHATARYLVQIGGRALRIGADDFATALAELPVLRHAAMRYVAGFINLALLQVACNRIHRVEQRLARWLLMTRDRSPGDLLHLTHEMLGEMLGVHRPTVTHALKALRSGGLVSSGRGGLRIMDRAGLEAVACECYAQVRRAVPAGCG